MEPHKLEIPEERIITLRTALHTRVWQRILEHRRKTSEINFDCRITEKGCKSGSNRGPMCCCTGCSWNSGYLIRGNNLILDTDLPRYKEAWDEITGFWREKIGCILPRELRSTTCLLHYCELGSKEDFTLRSKIDNSLFRLMRFLTVGVGHRKVF